MTNTLKSILRLINKSPAFTLLHAARRSAGRFNWSYRRRVVSVFVSIFRRPGGGWLLAGKYAHSGKILYEDSIASLTRLNRTVNLFFKDSENRKYMTTRSNLGAPAVILGDNSHINDRLARYSEEHGRRCLFFQEKLTDHWYPANGIGISFRARQGTP